MVDSSKMVPNDPDVSSGIHALIQTLIHCPGLVCVTDRIRQKRWYAPSETEQRRHCGFSLGGDAFPPPLFPISVSSSPHSLGKPDGEAQTMRN